MDRDTLINKLKGDIAAGRVVTIAGTGVSVTTCGNQEVEGYKVATWPGLLQHGVKHCKEIGAADDGDVQLLTLQIATGKTDFLISAAETISQRMKGKSDGVFRGWLKNTIGQLKVTQRDVGEALAAIPGVIATLNYDNLLEETTGRVAVTWLDTDEVQEVLTRTHPGAVLHLHGWYKEPKSVVLGLNSYAAVKDHPHTRAVLDLFTIDRTILFVGCGDTVLDPNFTRLIEWGKEALKDVSPRHYLLCRTSEVAEFQTKLAAAPWIQILAYGAEYQDLIPFLRALLPVAGTVASAKMPTAASLDLAAYQQAMRKRYSRLKLEDLDPTTHDIRPMTLIGMFIAATARECCEFLPGVFELPKEMQRRLREAGEMEDSDVDEKAMEDYRRTYLDQSPLPILEITGDPALNRLVILGDPGSGKSTLLQYLLLQWAEKAAPDLALEPLPLLIELREYARLRVEGKADSFTGFLHDGAGVRWHLDQIQLDAWLKENHSVVLFDGLDEVFDPVLRREVSTAIHRFADTYPLARIVVTSRVIGFQHQAWRDEDFRHFMLQDLDEQHIAEFLARWHNLAYEEPTRGEAKRALLAKAIEDSAAIRQLAGNPLLLTMMAILNRTQDLPRDRAELYEQCARLLLHQWKVEGAFAPDPELAKASLDYKDKRGLLQRVARAMQSSEGGLAANLIDEDTLERTLAEGLKDVPNLRPDRAARALIEQLRGRNFMLCSVGGRSYAFVHRTFLEYFCAVEIRERFQTEQSLTIDQLKEDVFGHSPDEKWHEVLCLLSGMLAPHFVKEVLEWLLLRTDPDSALNNLFLSARCVAEVRKRSLLGDVEEQVRRRLMTLGESDSDVLNSRSWGKVPEVIASIWPDLEETRAWLTARALATNNLIVAKSAIRELVKRWNNHPETLKLVLMATTSNDWGMRIMSYLHLSITWRNAPETLTVLKAAVQSKETEYIRQYLIRVLAEIGNNDPETFIVLKALAESEKNKEVRQTAKNVLKRMQQS